jgi:hypothetical protein
MGVEGASVPNISRSRGTRPARPPAGHRRSASSVRAATVTVTAGLPAPVVVRSSSGSIVTDTCLWPPGVASEPHIRLATLLGSVCGCTACVRATAQLQPSKQPGPARYTDRCVYTQ